MIKGISAAAGASALGYCLVTTGKLTLDTGWGRRTRPPGPLSIDITAAAEKVYDVIAAPYLDRTPCAMAASCGCSTAARTWCWPSITPRYTAAR
jgi:hypothetical protein